MNRIRTGTICVLFLATGFTFAMSARAGEVAPPKTTLYVVSPAIYGPNVKIHQRVKDECQLDRRVAEEVAVKAGKVFDEVVTIDDVAKAGKEKVVLLSIVGASGVGGGGWSGSKSITVEAKLMQDGKELGKNSRYSTSRGNGFTISTCSIFERTVDQVADVTAKWLRSQLNSASSANAPEPVEEKPDPEK